MSSNVTTKVRQPHAAERIKHLFQWIENSPGPGKALAPFFCVEARIDFNDVRTGFRETVSLSKALEIYSDNADLLWTDDMIRDVDLTKTTTFMPDGIILEPLPNFVDSTFLTQMENQFAQYLLRSFEVRVYRNFDLNLYSFSGESRSDFCRRCLELFESPRRQELESLHEVFTRKLEQARQKYVGVSEESELEQARAESENKDAFSRCLERVSELFSKAELRMKPVPALQCLPGMQEFEERLLSLESEAHKEISRLSDAYDDKARSIDEYILHPNPKDIHFVRSGILWLSRGVS